ncbi:hypothetical protein HRbin04_00003 [archaeon HR04]|nr:hypothetical protein HRbin04_00003 [archaeon HR04]
MQSNEELKKRLLDMLEQDKEFRYAVAGAIGYKEILDRIVALEERMNERFAKVDERFAKVDERFAKVEEDIRDLRKDLNDLRRDMQEGFRRHDEEFARIRRDIGEIRRYMERTSLTLEEEARDVISYRLKDKGLTLSISRLELPDIEIDIYGIDTEYCIVGEVKTRASPKVIEEVDKDIEMLCSKYPSYLRKRIIKAIYAMQVTPDAVKEAEKRKIWVVTATKDLTPLVI